MECFLVLEVGSTTTKSYLYESGVVKPLDLIPIFFKKNYQEMGHLFDQDIQKLFSYLHSLESYQCPIYTYGTSIFRDLIETERKSFLQSFVEEFKTSFTIVSAKEESELTVYGVLHHIQNEVSLAIMVGGGGSTELTIIEHGEVTKQVNYSFGAMDICKKYPDINENIATTPFSLMVDETLDLLDLSNSSIPLLVLAGGDYLKFYETLPYELDKNTYYDDVNQPYVISKKTAFDYDEDFFYHQSLTLIQEKNPDSKEWWTGGTRGMRIIVEAMTEAVGAEVIIPTRINMIYGIIAQIEQK